ncbi:MAG: DUF5103 domain-containing protein ['Candidatus Kapabacteria' thiocyanatum]|nr:DUF5103 domain-containing protein ['Candidatus Kapabacteria' thiocyanatum]
MRALAILLLALCGVLPGMAAQADDDATAVIRFIRAYGSKDERMPPVVLMDSPTTSQQIIGAQFATVEFDVQAATIPNLYARLVHCTADWEDDPNGFVNDVMNRTSLFDWKVAPQRSSYFNYRGALQIPNDQIQIRFSGNYKVRIYDISTDKLLAETRIFVVQPMAEMQFNFMTDFYEPRFKVSSIALTLEAVVRTQSASLISNLLNTVVLYRNARWYEPFIISERLQTITNPPQSSTYVGGLFAGGKVFRIERIPAENEYRILDLSNMALFPNTGQPVRLPLSDLRRNGSFLQRTDDGVMTTSMISSYNDEYVPIEFILDPLPYPSELDVFVVGSFNNWRPDRTWQMYYDEETRLYRLRQWVRRGIHNYMYASGTYNIDNGEFKDFTFEEFEGNTASAGHGFVAFAYYRMQDYGGYDGIIAVGNTNIYQSGR